VEQGAQVRIVVLGPGVVQGLGLAGLLAQASQAVGGEGTKGIADGLGRAPQEGGDVGRGVALVAGEKDLTAAQAEGVAGAQPQPQGGPFVLGKGADEERWFHTPFYAPAPLAQDVSWVCIRSPPRS
jgi:hypothetical protein